MAIQNSFTIPANTPQSTPVEMQIIVAAGILRSISVYFPEGCRNAVGIRFLDFGRQFWPLTGWIYGAGRMAVWSGRRKLEGPSYRLIVQGWSFARDWPHTVEIETEVTMS